VPTNHSDKWCGCNGDVGPPIPPSPPPAPPPPPPPPGPCKAAVDVVIVLDGSGSIVATDWAHALDFANKLVDAFNVSAVEAEIAAVQFSDVAETIIGLSSDPTAIKAAVTAEAQIALGTNTYDGFERARTILEGSSRSPKGKIVFLVTDGRQDQGMPAMAQAVELQKEGVIIFGIGVGRDVDERELESWVSTPVSQHYFKVDHFADLLVIVQKVVRNACPPPSRAA
jgi:uncharacterized protein YegL